MLLIIKKNVKKTTTNQAFSLLSNEIKNNGHPYLPILSGQVNLPVISLDNLKNKKKRIGKIFIYSRF